MSDGFDYFYRRPWGATHAGEVIGALEGSGLQLDNPRTALITLIESGPESWGEQAPTTRELLVESAGLLAVEEVNLQFWLDGASPVRRSRSLRRVRRGPAGSTEESDWDSIVLKGAPLRHGWPDALGVRPEIAAAHVQLAQAEGRAEPPLTVFGQRFGEW